MLIVLLLICALLVYTMILSELRKGVKLINPKTKQVPQPGCSFQEKNSMSSAMQRMLAVVVTALIVLMFTPGAQGQGRWVRLAPFPEPNEELYGVAAGGKMYVI